VKRDDASRITHHVPRITVHALPAPNPPISQLTNPPIYQSTNLPTYLSTYLPVSHSPYSPLFPSIFAHVSRKGSVRLKTR